MTHSASNPNQLDVLVHFKMVHHYETDSSILHLKI